MEDIETILNMLNEPAGVKEAVYQMKKQRQNGQAARSQESILAEKLHINEFDVEFVDQCSYFITLKLFGHTGKSVPTNFAEIKRAAVDYWGFHECENYFVLTDEYFNNLCAYRDTVNNFFTQDTDERKYQPLNSYGHACVFFVCKNTRKSEIHEL